MRREWVTAVCCGLAIAIPTIAQAQEFQVFDHRLSKVEKRADKEVTYAPSLAVSRDSNVRISTKGKQLLLPAIAVFQAPKLRTVAFYEEE